MHIRVSGVSSVISTIIRNDPSVSTESTHSLQHFQASSLRNKHKQVSDVINSSITIPSFLDFYPNRVIKNLPSGSESHWFDDSQLLVALSLSSLNIIRCAGPVGLNPSAGCWMSDHILPIFVEYTREKGFEFSSNWGGSFDGAVCAIARWGTFPGRFPSWYICISFFLACQKQLVAHLLNAHLIRSRPGVPL